MKNHRLVQTAAATAILVLTATSALSDTMFRDTFDRAADTNLNASTDGKSGQFGMLNYTVKEFSSLPDPVGITNNMLYVKGDATTGGSFVFINDHNFTDAGIVTNAGGFSISIDLTAYSTGGTNRYLGIGVGQSFADLDGAANWQAGMAGDLFVGYHWTAAQSLDLFTNGVLAATNSISAYPVPQTLRIDYAVSNFGAGSTVSYDAYLGPTNSGATNLIYSGSFNWSGSDENYISILGNVSAAGSFDNLDITSDLSPPQIASLSPTNSATEVQPDADLVVTFDENILTNAGNIIVTNLTDSTGIVISVSGADPDGVISVSGYQLIIDPAWPLDVFDTYAVRIDSGVVEDLEGNPFPGITNDTTWQFTITTDLNWSLVAYWPFNEGPIGSISSGTIMDDLVDSGSGDETNGVANSGGSYVYDAQLDRIVWRTPDFNRAQAGRTEMNRDFTWCNWNRDGAKDTTDNGVGAFMLDDMNCEWRALGEGRVGFLAGVESVETQTAHS